MSKEFRRLYEIYRELKKLDHRVVEKIISEYPEAGILYPLLYPPKERFISRAATLDGAGRRREEMILSAP